MDQQQHCKSLRAMHGDNAPWPVPASEQCARCGRNIFLGRNRREPETAWALLLADGRYWCTRAECVRGTAGIAYFTSCTMAE
jgi:hypothetical protein